MRAGELCSWTELEPLDGFSRAFCYVSVGSSRAVRSAKGFLRNCGELVAARAAALGSTSETQQGHPHHKNNSCLSLCVSLSPSHQDPAQATGIRAPPLDDGERPCAKGVPTNLITQTTVV